MRALLDTGPLVALLDRRDDHHAWAKTAFAELTPPLLTCEAVLSESCFLLGHARGGAAGVIELLRRKVIAVSFRIEEESEPVSRLLERYASVPMSLADACLVRMAELHADAVVVTVDGDFRVYRKHRRQIIPLRMPDMRR